MKRYQRYGLWWAATTFVGVATIGAVTAVTFANATGNVLTVIGLPSLAVTLAFVGVNLFRYVEKYPTD